MQMLQELRYAIRQLRKAPIFTLVAIATLALGIGANTAVFTLLDQALLRLLPVSHPERLVRLQFTGSARGHFNSFGGDDHDYFSYPMYRDLRDRNQVLENLIASDLQNVSATWNNQPEMVGCELASGNYFQALGLQPAMGRLFVPADDVPNSSPVVVLSFNYWKRQFGSDPRVINQTLLINAHPFTIVGVAPPGFHSLIAGATEEVFVPLTTKNVITPRWQDLEDLNSHWLMIVGRLKPGVSRAQAEAGLQPLWHALRAAELAKIPNASARLRRTYLDESRIQVLDSARGFSPLRDQIGTPLLIVMGMVFLLVLMACVNVSSLLLVRAAGRVREMSVRYAMGAGRWQIVRQLLVEGVLLGLLGGSLGLMLAPAVSSVLIRRVVGESATDLPFSSSVDTRVLLFNFGLALVVSILFSLAPALRFLHPDVVNSLKQQSTTSSGGPLRFRRALVGAQIGLSLLLLIGAGLFVRTLHNLRTLDVGFATDHLVTFSINPRLAGYQPEQVVPLFRRIQQSLSTMPGTRSVAATDDPDLADENDNGDVTVQGHTAQEGEDMQAEEPNVTPDYFLTMKVPVLAGRTFTEDDVAGKSKVAVVNAAFARHFFGEPQNAVGKLIRFGGGADAKLDTEIVGVVGDTRHAHIRDEVVRTAYRPWLQLTQPNFLTLHVRTWQPPEAALANIRNTMQQVDSKLALSNLRTMDVQIDDNLSAERLVALLAVSFGVLAVLLAAIGLYGVLAYVTAQRTREIGIRMALGAQRGSVMGLVLRDVLWLAGISIVLTLPVALLLARLLRSQLYGVSPADPLTLCGGTLLVAAVALLAALLPARRAASVDPMKALRTE
jgi:putative ABC transport system permease protein